jgi:hypothetical protein
MSEPSATLKLLASCCIDDPIEVASPSPKHAGPSFLLSKLLSVILIRTSSFCGQRSKEGMIPLGGHGENRGTSLESNRYILRKFLLTTILNIFPLPSPLVTINIKVCTVREIFCVSVVTAKIFWNRCSRPSV